MGGCVYLHDGRCVQGRPGCEGCGGRLDAADPGLADRWEDPLQVIDRRRNPASAVLRDVLAGGAAFLLCGGPSANEVELDRLAWRGCWTMGVNNAAGHPRVRPQAFVCSDPPQKFSHSIWYDPGVMKFVPTPKLGGYRANLRVKRDGEFSRAERKTADCPNVWGFQRWSWLHPDDRFFSTDGACWGNNEKESKRTGQPKTVCTMLLGLRLLRFLGARTVFLLGVDFRMTPEAGYSFGQGRDAGACASNNNLFRTVNGWLCEMAERGVFDRFGMKVYNCNPTSGLRAFPHVPFNKAVEAAAGIIERMPDLSKWYEK